MNVTESLHDLVADEPPYTLRPDDVLGRGRRRRARRRGAVVGTIVLTAGAVTAGVLASAGAPVKDRVTVFGGPSDQARTASTAAQRPAGKHAAIERAVRDNTPSDWTISDVATADPGGLIATVDDGSGAGRLSVGTSPSPGSLQQHPCADHEFALGASCSEQQQADGSRLIRRGPARVGSVATVGVVIVHPDGSGVAVDSYNATWPTVDLRPGQRVTPEQKRALGTPTVTRAEPLYSADQLVRIARAVDAQR